MVYAMIDSIRLINKYQKRHDKQVQRNFRILDITEMIDIIKVFKMKNIVKCCTGWPDHNIYTARPVLSGNSEDNAVV
uniref:Uncharacterized protein n=1 Tax=Oryza barthii TaxID=65489 RepID=A0A0D3EP75_9ORYZ